MQNWYVVICKTGQEDRAAENLFRQSFEAYLPLVIETLPVGSKRTPRVLPLFPDYIFVNFDPEVESASKINNSYGAIGLLTFGDVLVPVPKGVVEMLKKSAAHVNSNVDVATDDTVSDEVKTIFKEKDGTNRNFMLINLLSTKYKVKAA